MTTKAERTTMLDKYDNSLSKEAREKGQYRAHVAKYLDFVGCNELSRASIQRYIDSLREHYSDGSIKNIFNAIRRFYIVNDLEWPFRRSEAPIVRESQRYAPAIHPDIIADYIRAAMDGKLTKAEAAFLALSTTYGMRPEELRGIRVSDIDLKEKLIFVHTLKHGRERWHKLPDVIIPFIENYSFTKISEYSERLLFISIVEKSGHQHIKETGFHAIRRTLVTLLEKTCSRGEVHKFLRWADIDMVDKYTAVTFVGKEEDTQGLPSEDQNVDDKVFAQHPFLKMWEGEK